MPDKNWQFELEEYIKQGEPDRAEKSSVFTAITSGEPPALRLRTIPKKRISYLQE